MGRAHGRPILRRRLGREDVAQMNSFAGDPMQHEYGAEVVFAVRIALAQPANHLLAAPAGVDRLAISFKCIPLLTRERRGQSGVIMS